MKFLKKIIDFIDMVLENLAMLFLVLMTLIITYQVATRYFLNKTPYWSEEISLLLMVWFGFMGIAIGVKKGIHISIQFFAERLPASMQKVVIKIDELLIGVFGVLLFVHGIGLCKKTAVSTMAATQWPTSTLYIMVPVSGFMIVVYSLSKIFGIEDDIEIEKRCIDEK
ncbi:TRAP transporter small permease [Clostridiisalibacter paucivorans]|uniref:TRAP transporter small permease n=1 Tax=Clostridiisalibacter paucivorans TaxID=408753 RepID=UPI000687D34B|nr:TRAP transporter small permease [Clostridiisalibacter paucivorans]